MTSETIGMVHIKEEITAPNEDTDDDCEIVNERRVVKSKQRKDNENPTNNCDQDMKDVMTEKANSKVPQLVTIENYEPAKGKEFFWKIFFTVQSVLHFLKQNLWLTLENQWFWTPIGPKNVINKDGIIQIVILGE